LASIKEENGNKKDPDGYIISFGGRPAAG